MTLIPERNWMIGFKMINTIFVVAFLAIFVYSIIM